MSGPMKMNGPTASATMSRQHPFLRSLQLGLAALLVGLCALPAAATKYLAFGDSITEGVGFDDCACNCRDECGYPVRLERLLQQAGVQATVLNAGLGGERTAEGVVRIDQHLRGHDVLLLMEGTNDIFWHVSPETTLFNLNVMAEKAENRGLSVVHATLIPRTPQDPSDASNEVNERVARGVRRLAYDRGRRLADPFEVFGSIPDLFTTLYTPGDVIGHPNPAGFQRLAEIFFDVVQEVDSVPPVVGLVTPPDGSVDVPAGAEVRVRLFDFGAGIDLSATDLLIGGEEVEATQLGDSRVLDLVYAPAGGLSGVVRVGYRATDRAEPPNMAERQVAELVVEGTTFLPGDLDRDGRVDGADLVRLARAFGARRGQPRFDAAADLDGNNLVDGADLAILAANFGLSSP
jgi:lysophospholipase L1-like esterase